jgi:hypothetical protein
MKSVTLFYVVIVLITSLLVSCKKDSENNDTTAVLDNAMVESESNRVIQAVNSSAYDNGVNKPEGGQGLDSILPSCAVVTIDTSAALNTITIDFGSEPCLCSNWDNRYRQGTIRAEWSGHYRDSATVITITTTGYFQGVLPTEMNQFDFNKTITNMGHNTNGNLHYAINVTSANVTLYFGATVAWTSQRDREWIIGESTLLPFDDVYSVTGSASGTDENGNPFTVTITTPLIIAFLCPWIEQGTLKIEHGIYPTATLDYGSGDCDAQATITINGVTTTFVVG